MKSAFRIFVTLYIWHFVEAKLDCQDGVITIDGRCIKYIPYGRENECHDNGGHLATIDSANTMELIRKEMVFSWNLTSAFIGLRKLTGNGTYSDYIYEDGRPLSFTAWSTKTEPDGFGSEKCVIVLLDKSDMSLVWHDVICRYIAPVLCQWESPAARYKGLAPSFLGIWNPSEAKWEHDIYPVGVFVCRSGEAIFAAYVCDNIPHCDDASDEETCDHVQIGCTTDQFQCEDGTCISVSLYCDFRVDCSDKSDESKCEHLRCGTNEWTCNNGECIKMEEICDNKFDCIDQSDESTLTCTNCKKSELLNGCANGVCIKPSRLCDGYQDCDDTTGSDETFCSSKDRTYFSCTTMFLDSTVNKTEQKGDIHLGHTEYEASTVDCRKENGSVFTVWSSPKRDRYFPNPFVGSKIIHVTYRSQKLMSQLISISSQCWQWIRIVCLYDNLNNPSDIEVISPSVNYTAKNCPNKPCQCNTGTVLCELDTHLCECQITVPTNLEPNNCHDGWTLVNDKDKLPIKDVRLQYGKSQIHISSMFCEEDLTKFPGEFMDTRFHCKNGALTYNRHRCLLHINPTGDPYGCRDLSHLEGCGKMKCPPNYIKCPNSYCIHVRHLCDSHSHCPNSEDELECDTFSCPGYYRCRDSKSCIPYDMICDTVRQCPKGDDEWNCDFRCPDHCTCNGLAVTCNRFSSNSSLPRNTRALVIRNSNINFPQIGFADNQMLANLILSNCGIDDLKNMKFVHLKNLVYLDLSNNNLSYISAFAFIGLRNVRTLILRGNKMIQHFEPKAFLGLTNLLQFELTHTNLANLKPNSFEGLRNLKLLNISNNENLDISNGVFNNLTKLKTLDIRSSSYIPPTKHMFSGLANLEFLYSRQFTHCCVKPTSVPIQNCFAPFDAISSCEDLINDKFLRISLWIIGMFAFFGNVGALVARRCCRRDKKYLQFERFLDNLGLSDSLMGLYLLAIGGVDMYFRNIYVWNEYTWRYSTVCNFLGVIATTSCEASVLFILIITIDRLFAVKYPFMALMRHTLYPYISCLVIWIISVGIAVIPILYPPYFQSEFYSISGVCIALPLSTDYPVGWEYSVVIFIVLNFTIFIGVASGQFCIYREIKKTSAVAKSQRQSRDQSVARQLLLIILTDFMCWFPIGLIGILTFGGFQTDNTVYAWIVVFVMPINSALNPFLYTFRSLLTEQCREMKKSRNSSSLSSGRPVTINAVISLMQSDLFQQDSNPNTLESFLQKRGPSILEIFVLTKRITKALQILHDNGMVYSGHVTEKSIALGKKEKPG